MPLKPPLLIVMLVSSLAGSPGSRRAGGELCSIISALLIIHRNDGEVDSIYLWMKRKFFWVTLASSSLLHRHVTGSHHARDAATLDLLFLIHKYIL